MGEQTFFFWLNLLPSYSIGLQGDNKRFFQNSVDLNIFNKCYKKAGSIAERSRASIFQYFVLIVVRVPSLNPSDGKQNIHILFVYIRD